MQGLHFLVILDAHAAAFAAVTRLLVAAERAAVLETAAVDMHRAGAQAGRDPLRAFRIAGLQVGGQAVGRVVGNPDGLVLVIEGDQLCRDTCESPSRSVARARPRFGAAFGRTV